MLFKENSQFYLEEKMTPDEIAQEAIRRMNTRITNEIFLIIQNDRDLMQEYLRAVENNPGGLGTVNKTIGKKVKNSYGLVNMNDRENNPSCTLIQSHQIFE
jgi:rRNA processing protein Gar1